jgi:leucyl/phenylalanyl-tRNA---protein transferase
VEAWQGQAADRRTLRDLFSDVPFCGESMFSQAEQRFQSGLRNAFVERLCGLGFELIDCQVKTDHLIRFGAREVPRKLFLQQLAQAIAKP